MTHPDGLPVDHAAAIAHELAALLDEHLHELRSRGVSETVLAPLEAELRRHQDRAAS